ncbi:molybdopterin converting factor subunit 1 [Chitinophaga barathri]|uniref:Molybdopterin synthase sulfur carrier subunit n=1 Tax=Chitinophaga barathri TaxID=1647451 RepID=A0A3N4N189_9BACT|nr:molybdopterin converting factor subunit 1 [Chitinophaga barathri]RPD41383.1 molybdopterin converting factor subunit 1 [Chitinophaga barathri]
MKIMFFGIAKELAGGATLEITEKPGTVGQFREWLIRQYPAMRELRKVMIAVNKTYATDEQTIADDDEIAVIPPLSGG